MTQAITFKVIHMHDDAYITNLRDNKWQH